MNQNTPESVDPSDPAFRFLKLFDGWPDHHLEWCPGDKDANGKKRGSYKIVEGELTAGLVERHFAGDVSIGVSPLRKDGTCVFGVIDIDIPDMDLEVVNKVVAMARTRCAIFQSKSRGIHVYIFVDEPVPAKLMVDYLAMVRKRLPKDVQQKAPELFPKQTDPKGVERPSAINLPMFGKSREPIGALGQDKQVIKAYDDEVPSEIFAAIYEHCRLTPDIMRQFLIDRQLVVDTSKAGYRVPNDAAGRQDLLWKIACSMQSRGWLDSELEAELRRLNSEFANTHDLFTDKGPLEEGRIADIVRRILKMEKGSPAQLNFREVEKFNRDYAMIDIDGKIEFLDQSADEFRTYTHGDFKLKTANRAIKNGNRMQPISDLWLRDIHRAEFQGVVTEPLEYAGRAYNIWRGFAVEPQGGDAGPFLEVVRDILCGGDEALSNWVLHWLADAVQRPTEPSPPSALALRGPQGHGKSYLVEFLEKILGQRYVQFVQESSRLFSRFNREMFGVTIVAAEESIFHGSEASAAQLKAFISSPTWTYEAKHKAVFNAKNVHRLIATTNSDQAVHLDYDDRRWTVVEVPRRWDLSTDDGREKANADWDPYWQFLRGDGPAIVLNHLLGLKVEKELIRYGYITEAKAHDKIQSNPLLAVLDEIADKGIIPDDMDGSGLLASKPLTKAVKDEGGLSSRAKNSAQVMAEFDKLVPGCETIRKATFVKEIKTFSDGGLREVEPLIERDQRGRDLGTLAAFRQMVAKHTRKEYEADGEWGGWVVPVLGDLPISNGKDGHDGESRARNFVEQNPCRIRMSAPRDDIPDCRPNNAEKSRYGRDNLDPDEDIPF